MPKAARARVASPPAGTALARVAGECLPGRVRQERGSILHVTLSVTDVNGTVTTYFQRSWPDLARLRAEAEVFLVSCNNPSAGEGPACRSSRLAGHALPT